MSTVYILQLEHGKYYVGKTDDVSRRYSEHKSGKGSEWTKIHKPLKLLETRQLTSEHDETNFTKDLMKKYGVENVRGGAYCQVDLPEYVEDAVRHELRSNDDRCFKCGKTGHFANQCKRKSSFKAICHCGKEFLDFNESIVHMKNCRKPSSSSSDKCYRCGRVGHWASSCYAKTHVKGYYLDSDDEYDSD